MKFTVAFNWFACGLTLSGALFSYSGERFSWAAFFLVLALANAALAMLIARRS